MIQRTKPPLGVGGGFCENELTKDLHDPAERDFVVSLLSLHDSDRREPDRKTYSPNNRTYLFPPPRLSRPVERSDQEHVDPGFQKPSVRSGSIPYH